MQILLNQADHLINQDILKQANNPLITPGLLRNLLSSNLNKQITTFHFKDFAKITNLTISELTTAPWTSYEDVQATLDKIAAKSILDQQQYHQALCSTTAYLLASATLLTVQLQGKQYYPFGSIDHAHLLEDLKQQLDAWQQEDWGLSAQEIVASKKQKQQLLCMPLYSHAKQVISTYAQHICEEQCSLQLLTEDYILDLQWHPHPQQQQQQTGDGHKQTEEEEDEGTANTGVDPRRP